MIKKRTSIVRFAWVMLLPALAALFVWTAAEDISVDSRSPHLIGGCEEIYSYSIPITNMSAEPVDSDYEAFLQTRTPSESYAIVDVNGDGQDELLLTMETWSESNDLVQLEPGYSVCTGFVDIYTYEDDHVVLLGSTGFGNMGYLSYSSTERSMYYEWGGAGAVQYIGVELVDGALVENDTLTLNLDTNTAYYNDEIISMEKFDELRSQQCADAQYVLFRKNDPGLVAEIWSGMCYCGAEYIHYSIPEFLYDSEEADAINRDIGQRFSWLSGHQCYDVNGAYPDKWCPAVSYRCNVADGLLHVTICVDRAEG